MKEEEELSRDGESIPAKGCRMMYGELNELTEGKSGELSVI